MSTISAGTTSTTTLVATGDTAGTLVFKTNDTGGGGTTALTLGTDQSVTFGGAVASPYTGFKNRIINGAMVIDQRNAGASLAVTAGTVQYSVDRFFGISSNAQCTLQQVTTSDSDFPYALRLARTTGGVGTGVIQGGQIIETNNCQDLAGQTVTLSFYATAGANFSAASSQIVVGLTCGSGTNQGAAAAFLTGTWTSQTTPLSTSQAITTTRTKYTYSVSIPSGTNEIGIRWYYTPVGTAGANDWFQITGVQLEKGSTATSFDYRAYGTELAMCQRYYCKTFDIGTAPGNNVSGVGELLGLNILSGTYEPGQSWRFPVAMRAAPTVTMYNPGAGTAGQWYDGTNSSANARAFNPGTSGVWFDNSGTGLGGARYRIQAVAAIEL
jgi:hypothetical protein